MSSPCIQELKFFCVSLKCVSLSLFVDNFAPMDSLSLYNIYQNNFNRSTIFTSYAHSSTHLLSFQETLFIILDLISNLAHGAVVLITFGVIFLS